MSCFRNGEKYRGRYAVEKVVPFFEGELAIAQYEGKRFYLQSAKLARQAPPRAIQQYLSLDHPLVMAYQEVYTEGQYIVSVRPYYAIQPLPHYVAKKGIDEEQFLSWAKQLVDLEQHLKNYNLPMYLLKDPRNIGITSEGKLKVIFCGVEQVTAYEPSIDWGTFFISLLKGKFPQDNVKQAINDLNLSQTLVRFLEKAMNNYQVELVRTLIDSVEQKSAKPAKIAPAPSLIDSHRQSAMKLDLGTVARPAFTMPKTERKLVQKIDMDKTIIRNADEWLKEEKSAVQEKQTIEEKPVLEKKPGLSLDPQKINIEELSQKTEFRLPLQAIREELERKERERLEELRKQLEQQEKDLMETYRREFEQRKQELLERQRQDLERQEQELLRKQKEEFERMQKERLKQELIKREQLEWERKMKERLEEERRAFEQRKKELLERLVREFEEQQKELLEQQRLEFERRKQERLAMQQRELEKMFGSFSFGSGSSLEDTQPVTQVKEEEAVSVEESESSVAGSYHPHLEENVTVQEKDLDVTEPQVEVQDEPAQEKAVEPQEKVEVAKSALDYETVQRINEQHARLARQFEEYDKYMNANKSPQNQ
ncbi:hypothetical protein [Thermoflavimicrobium dichotomicum]|uniref:Protein kinase domain-containing protein n=1 Tax=Thermoflavimicrobium dichotomicum TaxID=46223 RepID=A0A1I3JCJ4_9BACL|nr:hypothetical protein [Thermoflavimicrobium dichotomicum]SFI57866.1 hypothetical protein SAMN05421852_10119 [Thermoflavimicrobium dichotomicum]